MVIVGENGHRDPTSNPGHRDPTSNPWRGCLYFLGKGMNPTILPQTWVNRKTDWVL